MKLQIRLPLSPLLLSGKISLITRIFFGLIILMSVTAQAQTPLVPSEENPAADDQSLPLATISTGVLPQHVFLDPQGRYAAIFGQEKPDPLKPHRVDLYRGIPTIVVVIDLESMQVLRRELITGGIRDAFVDRERLYWVSKSVNLLNRLELATDQPVQKHPFTNPLLEILPFGKETIAVFVEESGEAQVKMFQRKNLEPIHNHPLEEFNFGKTRKQGSQTLKFAHPIGDNLVSLRGLWLVDQQDGTRRCLVSRFFGMPHFIRMESSGPSGKLHPQGKYAWKRGVFSSGVRKFQGSEIFSWSHQKTWDVSRTIPVTAVLDSTRTRQGMKAIIRIQDLVTGHVVHEIPLPEEIFSRNRSSFRAQFLRLGGHKVLVTFSDKVLVGQIPKSLIKGIKVPLRLIYPQAAYANSEKAIEFPLKAKGGSPPYEFSLTKPLEGLNLNPSTGLLEIDLPGIWKRFISDIAAGKRPDTAADNPITRVGFRMATGVDINRSQMGVGLPIWLSVTDSAGQDDQIFVNLPVVVPRADIQSARVKGENSRKLVRQERHKISARKGAERRAHDQLAHFGLGDFWFFVSQAFVYGIYLAIAVWYVWPWMSKQPIHQALTPVCLVTAVRIIGTTLLLPGILEQETSTLWLSPLAIADTIAAILGILGAVILYRGSNLAIPLVWGVALFGIGDTLLCYYTYMKATFEPAIIGSQFLVPVFAPMPAPVAYLLLLAFLIARPDRAHD